MIDAISPLMNESLPTSSSETSHSLPGFATWLSQNINGVNDKLISAADGLKQLATGETGNLHHVMLQLESAKLDFQLAVEVRNKMLQGYQEIMRMQI